MNLVESSLYLTTEYHRRFDSTYIRTWFQPRCLGYSPALFSLAKWSLVAARDRKQCAEVPTERRTTSLGGVNARWKIALVGAFREPATGLDKPDTRRFPAAAGWNTICRRGRLYRTLLFPACCSGSVVTSFDLAVALSVARHLCVPAHRLPSGPVNVQTGLHREQTGRAKPEPSQEACLHDRCLDTKNLDSRGTRRALSRIGTTKPLFPPEKHLRNNFLESRIKHREDLILEYLNVNEYFSLIFCKYHKYHELLFPFNV